MAFASQAATENAKVVVKKDYVQINIDWFYGEDKRNLLNRKANIRENVF